MSPSQTIGIDLDELDYEIDIDSLNEYPLVPKGTYPAVVSRLEPYVAQSTGSKNVFWWLTLTDEQFSNLRAQRYSTLLPIPSDPKKGWAFAKAMNAVGVSSKEIKKISDQIVAAVGKPCQVIIGHKQLTSNNGTEMTVSEIQGILPPDESQTGTGMTATEGGLF